MVGAVWSLVTASLALMLFGFVAWLYSAFGRVYVGLNGNAELILIGVALWAVRDQIVNAANSFTAALRAASKS